LSEILSTDFGWTGVAAIVAFYLAGPNNRAAWAIVAFAMVFYEYGYPYFSIKLQEFDIYMFRPGRYVFGLNYLHMFLCSLMAVVLVFLYDKNGKQGKVFKWLFYLFYPSHLLILTLIWLTIN
jgi:hypothetical protein